MKVNHKIKSSLFKIYLLFGIIGIVIITIISFSLYLGNRMIAQYTPLIDAAMEIKLETTTAHLWFEEILSGDREEDMELVWKNINNAEWYARAMLVGGENQEGVFIPLDKEKLQNDIRIVLKEIENFRQTTKIRFESKEFSGAGTEIDQHYDAQFKILIQKTDEVEARLQQIIACDLRKFRITQIVLTIISAIFFLITGIMVKRYERDRIRYFQTMQSINQNLREEITERKRTGKALQAERNNVQKYLNIAGVMIVILNEKGEITLINKKGCEILGYSIGEVLNKNWFELCIHEDMREEITVVFRNLMAGKIELVEYYENTVVNKKGEPRIIAFHNTIIKNEESQISGILFSGEDITGRKQAEEELRKHREQLEELVKERTGKLEEKTAKLEKSQQSLTFLLKDVNESRNELDKSNKELEEKAKRIEESQQALTYLVEDVNESRADLDIANKQLKDANTELEAFSYSVSHDLRAPLRHIDGFTKLLNRNIKDKIDEKSQKYFESIISSSKQMNKLIDDLLVFSRMGRKDMRKTNINMKIIVDEAVQEFASEIKENNISVIVDTMPDVYIDTSLITQVWVNLISNAIKFTGNNKNPEIHIGTDKDTDGNTVYFIKDNGVGFDQKYVDKIFGVFQRLHNVNEFPGTGIGLANVKRIILKHGGDIWADGEIDKGASFFFTLPKG